MRGGMPKSRKSLIGLVHQADQESMASPTLSAESEIAF
jgi:hypothetical protein